MAQGLLSYNSEADPNIMKQLVGKELVDGIVVENDD